MEYHLNALVAYLKPFATTSSKRYVDVIVAFKYGESDEGKYRCIRLFEYSKILRLDATDIKVLKIRQMSQTRPQSEKLIIHASKPLRPIRQVLGPENCRILSENRPHASYYLFPFSNNLELNSQDL